MFLPESLKAFVQVDLDADETDVSMNRLGVLQGSDVWSSDTRWTRVTESHPDGVISTLPAHAMRHSCATKKHLPVDFFL